MVTPTGTADRPARIRSLNSPRPLRLDADKDGRPALVYLSNRPHAAEVLETWRIDDEWWRQRPASRIYWRVLLDDGQMVDVYRDLVNGRWSKQMY